MRGCSLRQCWWCAAALYTEGMLTTRLATVVDAELIARHRRSMFVDARRRGIKVVSLHASKFGKPLYERNGFEATNEMILWLDGAQES